MESEASSAVLVLVAFSGHRSARIRIRGVHQALCRLRCDTGRASPAWSAMTASGAVFYAIWHIKKASFRPWRCCQSSRYHPVSLRFAPCQNPKALFFISASKR